MSNTLFHKKCLPCEDASYLLSNQDEDKYYEELDNWQLDRTNVHKISKEFKLANFMKVIAFVNKIAKLAEEEGHHPNLYIHDYKKLTCELYTHAIGGLSINDFIVASKIDRMFKEL